MTTISRSGLHRFITSSSQERKRPPAIVTIGLCAAFLGAGVGCQTAQGDTDARDRHAERFLKRSPEVFSLLDSSDRMAQGRSPDH